MVASPGSPSPADVQVSPPSSERRTFVGVVEALYV